MAELFQYAVSPEFEAAHDEWLRNGGPEFRKLYFLGPYGNYYSTPYWTLVRDAVLQLSSFKCCRCGGSANQVHHLHYRFTGEDHLHPESLVAVCRPCHGLVEYGRKAESLVSKIQRRISLCQAFVASDSRCREQTPIHTFSRLLEYRDNLEELRRLFEEQVLFTNKITSTQEIGRITRQAQEKDRNYEQKAKEELCKWSGNDIEKTRTIISLLGIEIEYCRAFACSVFKNEEKLSA